MKAANKSTGKKILLVEDDDVVAAIQRQLLARDGHEVHHEDSVSGALMYLARNKPDLIVTDLDFPAEGFNGRDLHLIRTGCPMVVMSRDHDADRFFPKHFEAAEFRLRVREALASPARKDTAPWQAPAPREKSDGHRLFDHSGLTSWLPLLVGGTVLAMMEHVLIVL